MEQTLEHRLIQLELETMKQRVATKMPHVFELANSRKKDKAEGDKNTFYMYGPIVEQSYFGPFFVSDASLDGLKDFLEKCDGEDVTIRINSFGGLASVGLSMFNLLNDYEGEITTKIDGIAASAATLPFIAGDKRVMGLGTQFMIHNPFVLAIGDYKELADLSERLRKSASSYAEVYSEISGQDQGEVQEAMDKETFYSSREAVKEGYATEVAKKEKAKKAKKAEAKKDSEGDSEASLDDREQAEDDAEDSTENEQAKAETDDDSDSESDDRNKEQAEKERSDKMRARMKFLREIELSRINPPKRK